MTHNRSFPSFWNSGLVLVIKKGSPTQEVLMRSQELLATIDCYVLAMYCHIAASNHLIDRKRSERCAKSLDAHMHATSTAVTGAAETSDRHN